MSEIDWFSDPGTAVGQNIFPISPPDKVLIFFGWRIMLRFLLWGVQWPAENPGFAGCNKQGHHPKPPPTHALSPARPPLTPSPDVAPARLRGRHRPALRPRRRGLSRAARRPGASVKIRRRLQKKADTTTMTALLDAKATRGERGADPGTAADLARLQSELGGCRNSTEELAAQLRGCAAHPSGPCIHRAQQQWRSRLPTGGEVRVRQRHTNHTGARPRCLAAAVEQRVASRRRQTQRRASTMKEIGASRRQHGPRHGGRTGWSLVANDLVESRCEPLVGVPPAVHRLTHGG